MDQATLNELLECSVCMDVLDSTSKVLPCQHTFCRRCLDEIVSTKKRLQCPECRMSVHTRVDDLPSNILLIRILESMKTTAFRTGSESKKSLPKHLSKKSSHPSAKSLYNYEAQEPGDLSFKKGEVINLRQRVDENWFVGELNGQQGFFPATYVKVLTPLPDGTPTCRALYDFVVDDDENKKDCLAFRKNHHELVMLLNSVYFFGAVPDDVTESLATRDKTATINHLHAPVTVSMFGCSDTQICDPEVRDLEAQNQVMTVIRRVDDNWVEGQLDKQIGILPISFVELNDSAKWMLSQPNIRKPTSNIIPPLEPPSANIADPADRAESNPTLQPLPNATAMASVNSLPWTSYHRPSVRAPNDVTSTTQGHRPQNANNRSKTLPVLYEALYNYKPQKDDEIELVKGDHYTVLEICQDGWFKGMAMSNSAFGIFPGNYVKSISFPSSTMSATNCHSTKSTGASYNNRLKCCSQTSPLSSHVQAPSEVLMASSSTCTGMARSHSRSLTNHVHGQAKSKDAAVNSAGNNLASTTLFGTMIGPSWLNLMSSSHVGRSTGGSETGRSRRSVKRSATCRAQSAMRTPFCDLNSSSDSSNLIGTPDETIDNVTRGLADQENANEVPSANSTSSAVVPSSSSGDTKRSDKQRFGFMKRLSLGVGKVKKFTTPNAEPESPKNKNTEEPRTQASNSDSIWTAEGETRPSSTRSASQPKPSAKSIFRCIAPYPAKGPGELELKLGDIVYVIQKRDDGWFRGILHRTGKTGYFPGSFVQNSGS